MAESPPSNPSVSEMLDDVATLVRLGLVEARSDRDGSPVISFTAEGHRVANELERLREDDTGDQFAVMFTAVVGEADDPRIASAEDALAFVLANNFVASHVWVVDELRTNSRTWLTLGNVLRPFGPAARAGEATPPE